MHKFDPYRDSNSWPQLFIAPSSFGEIIILEKRKCLSICVSAMSLSLSLSLSHSLALSEDFLVAKQMTPVKKSERKNCRKTKLATKYDFFTNKTFFIFLFPKFFYSFLSLSLFLSFCHFVSLFSLSLIILLVLSLPFSFVFLYIFVYLSKYFSSFHLSRFMILLSSPRFVS